MKKLYSGQFIKKISLTLILFSSLSCATSQKLETIEPSYNSAADIDLFLSTKDKKIEGIKDLRDESDKDGIRIVIECKNIMSISMHFLSTDWMERIKYC